jgi:hypothetical protein
MADQVEEAILNEARTEVIYADHKAGLMLATFGVGFGTVLRGLLTGEWSTTGLGWLGCLLFWMGFACAVAAVTCAGFAVWPRTHRTTDRTPIYYWRHVARYRTLVEYITALDERMPRRLDRTRHQTWEISRIVQRKYDLIRLAFLAAAIAVACFVLAPGAAGV